MELIDRFITQQGARADEVLFNSVLDACYRMGDVPRLENAFKKMLEYGLTPSAITYGTVVKAYGAAGDINSVIRIWEEMRQRGIGTIFVYDKDKNNDFTKQHLSKRNRNTHLLVFQFIFAKFLVSKFLFLIL